MSENLYDKLGVKHNATRDQIKAAAKKRRRETHPDLGGNEEEFKEIGTAVSVLLDPARRAEYDRSGTVRDGGALEDERAALAIVEQELATLINEYVTKGFKPEADPRCTDVISRIRIKITGEITQGNMAIPVGQKHKAFLEDFQRRLRAKEVGPEGDVLNRALQHQIEMADGNMANLKESIRIYRLALKLIENYEFDRTKKSDFFDEFTPAWMRIT